MKLLEDENYLGWKREDFFESAIRGLISSTVANMNWQDHDKFYEKHGPDVSVIYFPKDLDC